MHFTISNNHSANLAENTDKLQLYSNGIRFAIIIEIMNTIAVL